MWLTGKNLWLTGDQYSEKMAKAVQLSLWYGSYCKMPYLLFGPSKANARKISCLTFEVKNAAPNLISAVIHLRTHQATPFSQLGNGIFNYFSPRHSILSHATFLNVQRPLNLWSGRKKTCKASVCVCNNRQPDSRWTYSPRKTVSPSQPAAVDRQQLQGWPPRPSDHAEYKHPQPTQNLPSTALVLSDHHSLHHAVTVCYRSLLHHHWSHIKLTSCNYLHYILRFIIFVIKQSAELTWHSNNAFQWWPPCKRYIHH